METQLPGVLQSLRVRLGEWGFELAAESATDSFGDHLIVLAKSPMKVRLLSDRGQWFIELSCDGWDDWFDPDIWRSCLDDEPVSEEPAALSAQVDYIVRNVSRIMEIAAGSKAGLRACLANQRAARSRVRLGLDG